MVYKIFDRKAQIRSFCQEYESKIGATFHSVDYWISRGPAKAEDTIG